MKQNLKKKEKGKLKNARKKKLQEKIGFFFGDFTIYSNQIKKALINLSS